MAVVADGDLPEHTVIRSSGGSIDGVRSTRARGGSARSGGRTGGAGAAFDRLEADLHSLRGRNLYGGLYPGSPDRYFTCLRLDDQASDDHGFEPATVPGGRYGRSLVGEWSIKISQLPPLFDELHDALVGAGDQIDRTRLLVEYYRRRDALTIMIPVVGTDGVGG